LPAIELDRSSAVPLHEQVRARFVAAIGTGGRAGARLPSTRLLARMLGVSRNTILTVYEELAADGLIEGRPGSGMIVAHTPHGTVTPADPVRLLREAQYPLRAVQVDGPDGTSLFLVY
jgi:GntR family transcriptional regulator/MocR family aminotransferase